MKALNVKSRAKFRAGWYVFSTVDDYELRTFGPYASTDEFDRTAKSYAFLSSREQLRAKLMSIRCARKNG